MKLFDMLRSILQVKVYGKARIEEGHLYPAPYYWIWKWKVE